ncbi:MAG: 2'-5' RNA ligase family protein [Deinococcus sp.]
MTSAPLVAAPRTAGPIHFIGVRPPPELSDRVLRWQARLGHQITPPHVTLRAPPGLREAHLPACEAACEGVPSFELELGGVGTFGRRVISLSAAGPGLRRLHRALVEAVGLPSTTQELDGYHPHLTLALARRPLAGSWEDALASARAEFAKLDAQPLHFQVREAALFRKERPGQPYRVAALWPLGGAG